MISSIGISGNHNLAFMFNGVNYNLSSILGEAVNQIVESYRFDLIRIHFVSLFLTVILMLMVVQCLIPDHRIEKRKINHQSST